MNDVFDFISRNWDSILWILSGILSVATAVVRLTPSPKDDAWLRRVTGFFSFLEHRDVGGTKLPGFPAKRADRS